MFSCLSSSYAMKYICQEWLTIQCDKESHVVFPWPDQFLFFRYVVAQRIQLTLWKGETM